MCLSTIACCWFLLACGFATADETVRRFNRDIRPILSRNCFRCHGPDEGQRKADLKLHEQEGIAEMFKPGKLDDSEAWRRITSDDPEERMPPPGSKLKLTPKQIETVGRWIEQGAKWEGHWAFNPVEKPPVPVVKNADRVANPIDAFILAKLEREGVEPVGLADRTTLIRRLSFDLIGLPPTPAEVAAFEEQSIRNPQSAIQNLIGRLLDSRHYGERMAVYWLDLVRYADSVGYHKDSHRECWLYRDYVIDAFNDNKRFDQFAKEQLAGDLMEASKFEQFEWKIASGFNRMNQTTSEGGAQAKEYLTIYSADRVRNTAAIFLGTTLGCAQCHDHKYDPFTTKDFYSFTAFFADLQEQGVGYPKQTLMPTREQRLQWQKLEAQIAAQEKLLNGESADAIRENIKSLKEQLAKVTDEKTWHTTLITESGKPRTIRVLPRGNWLDDSGPVVTPAIPAFLGSLDIGDQRATRLELAEWITNRDNPLTARVFVNRLWMLLMGRGIARSLDDLGAQGQWPTHPDLLDWLAAEFIDSGWDVKHMVRLIVTSDAYRRSSICPDGLRGRDPENQFFARQTSWRLTAEFVRDNALAISGLFSPKMGGRSVRPYQPVNYWYRLYKEGKYEQDHGEDLYRRGVYTYWRRSYWHPSLQAFDAPAREECLAQRPRSNTPAQSLVLLNDPSYVEAARVVATKMIQEGGDTADQRIGWGFRRAVARVPSEAETEVLAALYAKQLARYDADPKAAEALVSIGESPVAKEMPVAELAAWTSVARAILNLHETITRN